MIEEKADFELKAQITGLGKIEHNINLAKDYAIAYRDKVKTLVFDETQMTEATKERANINNMGKKITEYRKSIISEFKKPIDDFEKTAKETERLLKEASDCIDVQVKAFQETQWETKKQIIAKLVNLPDGFILEYNPKWKNKTCKLEDVKVEIEDQVALFEKDKENMQNDISVIKMQTEDEKYIERYKFTRDLGSVLKSIADDKVDVVVTETHSGASKSYNTTKAYTYTYTFMGTEEQIESLKKYAREQLWMEVK